MLTVAQAADVLNLVETRIISSLQGDGWLAVGIQEAGDTANQLSGWTATGATLSNTDIGRLWWELSNSGTTRTVSAYKTSAKAAGDLVARGTRTGNGSVTLTAQNASGLGLTVTAAWTADDTDTGNILCVGLGGVKQIVAKSLPLDEMTTWAAVRPSLIVSADGVEERPGSLGTIGLAIPARIEWIARYGDLAAGRDAAQQVATRLRNWLMNQRVTSGQRIASLLDDGDGQVLACRAMTTDFPKGTGRKLSFACYARLEFVVSLRAAMG